MTELEKIERAKVYMDKLANGVNPVDDSVVPDEDVVNNVRLSRCFFFVADVLEQVIENGGIQPAETGKRPRRALWRFRLRRGRGLSIRKNRSRPAR